MDAEASLIDSDFLLRFATRGAVDLLNLINQPLAIPGGHLARPIGRPVLLLPDAESKRGG